MGILPDTRAAYHYGKRDPFWRGLGLFIFLLIVAWLSLLGLYDVLMTVSGWIH